MLCLTTGLFVMPAYAAGTENTDTTNPGSNPKTTEGSVAGAQDNSTAGGTTLEISKEILMFNTEGLEVYGPNVTYTYTILPAEGVIASITDKVGHTVQVKDGVAGAVSEKAEVTFSSSADDAKPVMTTVEGGKDIHVVSGRFSVTVDADAFSAPGVYRYVITDTTTDEALASAGITRPEGYDKVRYLDIYLGYDLADQDEDGSVEDFYISGCVLFRSRNGGGDVEYGVGTSFAYNDASSGSAKVTGYDVTPETGNDGCGADEFHTYNVTVTKLVTGTLGDKTNTWAFKAELGELDGRKYRVDYAGGQSGTVSDDRLTIETGLKNKQSFKIIGLIANAKVKVTEYNNIPLDYHAAVTADEKSIEYYVDGQVSTMIPSGSYGGTGWLAAKDAGAVTITNSLDALSPTGVVLRFGPDLLMLMMAFMTLLLMRMWDREDTIYDVI